MPKRIPSRDVFKPNAKVSHTFDGHIVGAFRRVGPNSWDDYEYVPGEGGTLTILPGLRVQAEDTGPRIRMRHRGDVVTVEWRPTQTDTTAQPTLATDESKHQDYFRQHYLGGFKNKAGVGVAAAIASLLRR